MSDVAVAGASGAAVGALLATGEYFCFQAAVPLLASKVGLAAAGATSLAAAPLIGTIALVAAGGLVIGLVVGGIWWLLKKCFGGRSGGAAQASATASAHASGPAVGGVAAGNISGVHQVVNVSNSEVEELKKKLQQKDVQIARLLRAMAAQKKLMEAQAQQMRTMQITMNAILLSLGQSPVVIAQDKDKAQPDVVAVDDDVLEDDVQEEDELIEDADDADILGL